MPAPDDPSLDAMLRELEQDDPVWGRVREKLGEQADEKGKTMDGTYLTPDALLYYCDAQLEGLDSQMNGIMNQQNSVNADEQHLKDAIDAMDQYNGGNPADLIQELRNDAAQIADPATQAKLNAIADDMKSSVVTVTTPGSSTPPANLPFSSTQIQNWTDSVKNIDSDLGSGSELAMIQLQSLMSERQVEIQLTTNLVQSLGDQANKIADNIGHS